MEKSDILDKILESLKMQDGFDGMIAAKLDKLLSTETPAETADIGIPRKNGQIDLFRIIIARPGRRKLFREGP
jgi:hypothetical protein